MTQDIITQYDEIIQDNSIAAIVMRQHLKPVEGDHAVIFPPTYSGIGYNIDTFDQAGEIRNVCIIDSVGSQANRMEPIFKKEPFRDLIPQISVEIRKPAKGKTEGDLIGKVDLLDAGHRIADAVIRFSNASDEIQRAFERLKKAKDAMPLAKLAPTSLVFGCWDSRGSQEKLPRIVRATIRAYNVQKLTRSSQYVPAVEKYEEAFEKLTDQQRKKFADAGMGHVPSTGNPGGVLLDSKSKIIKDAVLSLTALRALRATNDRGEEDKDNTINLRRYIFGLSLIALTVHQEPLLRMGCELTADPERPAAWEQVDCEGARKSLHISRQEALIFAQAAAQTFGVIENSSKIFTFDPKQAEKELTKKDKANQGE
ncbi:MAG TPA: type I-U CRISPR-associated RAMP protein Csb1/Cas7u [Smithellaceae bacterium]|jgi:CRISPR-associated protein Csb1|nr:type I-U CRISPR-associated RAMP protein Csb1/Cas7u [Candidatus Hydrogenedentota bacterium]HPL68098.1 type I-U CRISPR-associated RAMP protein Csb1/Cas7u [Smithellaceae bacterium]HQF85461.1 type I-U CRISPR-associated RAMP protein Csb1/Cas7u [Smithellaceae bacterium]HRR48224.1 type I-U CRISPR-associated RAMP protein Csb1/Cas7u [Syntrophales bacterium]